MVNSVRNSITDLLEKGSVVIMLGTGGVGKTTVAAALGIAAAGARINTALITVDPAKRLRDALGLERLGGRPKGLGAARLKAAGLDPKLRLSAMVLDVKGAWDGMVEQFAPDPETRRRILDNPFYRSLTGQFAGSEAYAALEQLYDLHTAGDFELEIVDTPPAAHAFEFLHAPARLARLLDTRAARWLFRPYLSASKFAMKLASRAARFVVRELERFAGASVLTSISDFFAAAAETVDAMVERLHKTEALLHSPAVRFVLVTTAEEDRLNQARELIEEMRAEGLRLSAIVINRFLDETSLEEIAGGADGTRAHLPGHLEEIGRLRSTLAADLPGDPGVSTLVDRLESYRAQALGDIERVARFARELPPEVNLLIAPEIAIGVRDLKALAHLARLLARGDTALRRLEKSRCGREGSESGIPRARQPRKKMTGGTPVLLRSLWNFRSRARVSPVRAGVAILKAPATTRQTDPLQFPKLFSELLHARAADGAVSVPPRLNTRSPHRRRPSMYR